MSTYNKGKAQQKLQRIEVSGLEGDFETSILEYRKQLLDAQAFYNVPRPVWDDYVDVQRKTTRTVKFDRLYLEVGQPEDSREYTELQIWGERALLPEEKQYLAMQEKKRKEESDARDAVEFERLRKKLNK